MIFSDEQTLIGDDYPSEVSISDFAGQDRRPADTAYYGPQKRSSIMLNKLGFALSSHKLDGQRRSSQTKPEVGQNRFLHREKSLKKENYKMKCFFNTISCF